MDNKIRINVMGISYGRSRGENIPYIVIMGKPEDDIRIPIIIGASEAQSIAIALEKIQAPRPFPHDLIASISKEFNLNVTEVIIHKYDEGVFFAKLVINCGNDIKEIDCRPSDGIAIAVRLNIPIYTYQEIFDDAGVNIKEKMKNRGSEYDDTDEEFEDIPIEELNDSQLKIRLERAIEDENYELAEILNNRLKNISK